MLTSTGPAVHQPNLRMVTSSLSPTAIRGAIGETVAGNCFMKSLLKEDGNWHSLTPRSGSQGLDHLFIKTNSHGLPKDLLVAESKYNTSRFGTTRDGIQMGHKWISKRFEALGTRYINVGKDSVTIEKMPLFPNRSVSVVLNDGKTVNFWKNSSSDSWRFSGRADQMKEAQRRALVYGRYLKGASVGKVSYRARIFNIIPSNNDLTVNTYDAGKGVTSGNLKVLPKVSSYTVRNAMSHPVGLTKGVDREIAKTLKGKMGISLSDRGALRMARGLIKKNSIRGLIASYPASRHITTHSVTKTGIKIPVKSLLGMPMNVSKVASGTFVGVFVSAGISYGMYFAGYTDLKQANRSMIIGSAASVAGALVSSGTMAAVATWGTASTGTAIASLSGAAATNATLAAIGGTVGGGAALGSAILTGGAALVVIGVTATGYWLYSVHDRNVECAYLERKLKAFSDNVIIPKPSVPYTIPPEAYTGAIVGQVYKLRKLPDEPVTKYPDVSTYISIFVIYWGVLAAPTAVADGYRFWRYSREKATNQALHRIQCYEAVLK